MKDGFSIGNILTLLSLFLVLGGSWATFQSNAADLNRRITTVEKRAEEDRDERRRDVGEVKQDVKEVKQDVQLILRKLDTIEAGQRAAERRERQR